MITVHHLAHSRSQRVLWLLEELDLPYEIRRYERDPKTMLAPPELKAVHPLGKSPVVVDDDGQAVAESGAIVEYLIDRHGGGRLKPPPDTRTRLDYTYWLHYAEGSAMPPLLLKLVFSEVERAPMPFFVKPIARRIAQEVHKAFIGPQLRTHLDYIDAHLAASPWFAGEALSGADIQMSFPLEAAAFGGEVDGRRPHIRAYLDRIHARPAYQRALARGGDYAYA